MANFNFNKVILGGRLTADPELKQTNSGLAVCSFSVAVNRKAAKEEDRKTDFISCTAWRQTAEFLARYFRKGASICLVGSLQVREWKDKDGNKRYATEVIVDEVNFVDSKGDTQEASASTPAPNCPPAYDPSGFKASEDEDDDSLPF